MKKTLLLLTQPVGWYAAKRLNKNEASGKEKNETLAHIGATIKIIVNGIAIAFNESYLDS